MTKLTQVAHEPFGCTFQTKLSVSLAAWASVAVMLTVKVPGDESVPLKLPFAEKLIPVSYTHLTLPTKRIV